MTIATFLTVIKASFWSLLIGAVIGALIAVLALHNNPAWAQKINGWVAGIKAVFKK